MQRNHQRDTHSPLCSALLRCVDLCVGVFRQRKSGRGQAAVMTPMAKGLDSYFPLWKNIHRDRLGGLEFGDHLRAQAEGLHVVVRITAHGRRSWEPAGRVGRSEGPQEGLQEQRWGHPHSPEAGRWPSRQISSSWVGKWWWWWWLVAKPFPTFCNLVDGILHRLLEFAQVLGPRTFGAWRWPPSWAGTSVQEGGCCLVPPPPPAPPPVCRGVE